MKIKSFAKDFAVVIGTFSGLIILAITLLVYPNEARTVFNFVLSLAKEAGKFISHQYFPWALVFLFILIFSINRITRRIKRLDPKVSNETIRIQPKRRDLWWHLGSSNNKPAMQVHGSWYVTNITEKEVLILRASLSRFMRPSINGTIIVRHPTDNIYGRYPILPNETTHASTSFWLLPPFKKEGKDFKATVILVDQFGNKHKIKQTIFTGLKPKSEKKPESPTESIYDIKGTVEKQIVSVLKAEVNRYKDCGRRVGGLGSVHTFYKNKTWRGVAEDCREADTPKNQSLVLKSENADISSDNADALLNLFNSLKTQTDQNSFVDALLKRLSKNTEYASVAYLILFVFFRLGKLPEVLRKAKKDLRKDETYGFSDFLIILDGLLRFHHYCFTSELLDEIERFVEGLDESTFRIRERIAAIRAFRLANPESNQ